MSERLSVPPELTLLINSMAVLPHVEGLVLAGPFGMISRKTAQVGLIAMHETVRALQRVKNSWSEELQQLGIRAGNLMLLGFCVTQATLMIVFAEGEPALLKALVEQKREDLRKQVALLEWQAKRPQSFWPTV